MSDRQPRQNHGPGRGRVVEKPKIFENHSKHWHTI